MECIAVFVNNKGQTASLTEEGFVKMYTRGKDNTWTETGSISFVPANNNGIAGLRKSITEMVQKLGDCRIFVASEVAGQLYNVLEASMFNIYEAEGKPEEFLDSVWNAEEAEMKAPSVNTDKPLNGFYPEKTENEGHYFLDLKSLLASKPELTSKQALIPFLSNADFTHLEVICDHLPRWFESEFEKLGLHSSISKFSGNEYKVSIQHKT